MAEPFVSDVSPSRAIEGGRVTLAGEFGDAGLFPDVRIQGRPARTVFASPKRLTVIVPGGGPDGGISAISLNEIATGHGLELGVPIATGLHQVDNPLIDRDGNVYLTYSGTRGQQVPVSIFRVAPNGARETYSTSVVNPTSMAMDAEGRLYVSSRFEGAVYRLADDGSAEPYATDLGIACGLAFAPDGRLFVGDRSGTIFSVDRSGTATVFASLPSSVAAFHLALGVDGLYVAGPTLSPYDVIYQIGFDGAVSVHSRAFGRPQGLAIGPDGSLFVVEALAGFSGLYRVRPDSAPELVVAGTGLIGLAFDPHGAMVVCSSDTAYRFGALS
jgi:DNA-binding beta-propeller fold protein YncE